MNASETVVQAANIDNATGQPHSTPGVAQMRCICSQTESSNPHTLRQLLMELIRAEVHGLVLIGVRIARKESLKFQGLALFELFKC